MPVPLDGTGSFLHWGHGGASLPAPRNPKASPLWRCIDAHFEELLQVYPGRYQPRYGVMRDVIPEVVGKFFGMRRPRKGLRPPGLPGMPLRLSGRLFLQGPLVLPLLPEPDRPPTSAQWRRLIVKIWESDPLTCPDCGAEMKVVSFIEDRRVVERILRHLDLLAEPSRGPPSDELVYEPFYDDLPVVEEEDVVYQPF